MKLINAAELSKARIESLEYWRRGCDVHRVRRAYCQSYVPTCAQHKTVQCTVLTVSLTCQHVHNTKLLYFMATVLYNL
jgi:hypothetical protein